jgi:hypothetical protein
MSRIEILEPGEDEPVRSKASSAAYLAEHFSSRLEGRGWIVLSRTARFRL